MDEPVSLAPPPLPSSRSGHRTRGFLVACAWILAIALFVVAEWIGPALAGGDGLGQAVVLPLVVVGSLLALGGAFTAFVAIFGEPRDGREPYVLAAVLAIGANLFAVTRFVRLLARVLFP